MVTGADLYQWRTERGLSQERLARALGLPQGTISRWETGARPIEHPVMLALALRSLERRYRRVLVV